MIRFAFFTMLLALPQGIHARIFTDQSGRTVEAEISRVTKTHVWLKVPTGKISRVSRGKLSAKDQTFIDQWIADQLPEVRITPDFVRSLKTKRGYFDKNSKQTFNFSVNFSNYSPKKALEKSDVVYYLIGRSMKNKDKYKVLARQVRTTSIPPNGSSAVKFKDIVNHYDSDRNWNEGSGHKALGYVLHVKRQRDGRTVHLSSPVTLLDKCKKDIILLKAQDVTGDDFIKAPEVPDEEGRAKKEPDVITIR